jgi:hypothetical protein
LLERERHEVAREIRRYWIAETSPSYMHAFAALQSDGRLGAVSASWWLRSNGYLPRADDIPQLPLNKFISRIQQSLELPRSVDSK